MSDKVRALPFVKSRFVDLIEDKFKAEEYQLALQKINEYGQLYAMPLELVLMKSICMFEYGQEAEAKTALLEFFNETHERSDFSLQSFDRMMVYYEGLEDWGQWFVLHFPQETKIIQVLMRFLEKMEDYPLEIDEFSNDLQLDGKRKAEFQMLFLEEGSPRLQLEWISLQTEAPTPELLEVMKLFLQDPAGHPICKSAMLAFLREQKLHEVVTVVKFNRSMTLNISDVTPFLNTQTFVQEVQEVMERSFAKEPVILQFALELLKKYSFVFEPFCDEDVEVFVKATREFIRELFDGLEPERLQDSKISLAVEKIRCSEEAFKELL